MAEVSKNQFCVIGLGEFGFSLAKTLSEKGAYVLAVDYDIDRIEEIKQYVAEAIKFDATDPVLLKEHGVFDADVVIVAIGEAFEPVVLISMELLKADVGRVISRASSDTQEMILQKIGIDEIIHPEKDVGVRMATSLLSSSISDFFQLSDEIGIFEIEAPEDMVGYSLKELKIRQRYNVSLITVKRPVKEEKEEVDAIVSNENESYKVMGVLSPDMKIKGGDRLIIMGKQESIEKIIEIN